MVAGPPHITRFIVPVVVGVAVQRQPRRASAHVRNERAEIIFPLFAHRDAATAVMFPLFIFWIVASFDSVGPRYIFFACLMPFGVAVLAYRFDILSASTAFCVATSQRPRRHDALLPTITITEPTCTAIFDIKKFYGFQVSEILASEINRFLSRTFKGNVFTALACSMPLIFIHESNIVIGCATVNKNEVIFGPDCSVQGVKLLP